MRAAPPVSVLCQGGPGWRWLQVGLPALSAAVLVMWAAGWVEAPPDLALAASVLAAGVVAGLAWRVTVPRSVLLSWDGQVWAADGMGGRLEVMVDLGHWLLLRLRPEDGHRMRWIALAAGEAGAHFHALRAAVYSRPPDATPRASPTRVPD